MHFDNIQIINESTFKVEIRHIFCHTSMLFKIYRNLNRGCTKMPEQINISTIAMNDKNHSLITK